jgi:hypothetical protein
MTLEEAMAISERQLPGEPPEPDWRPPAEPAKPAPQTDWSGVISRALKAERACLTEATGLAIGEVRNEVLDELDAAVEKLRAELRAEAARLRAEFSQANELRDLRVQLAEIKAMLAARSRKAPPPPQPPAASSNGDARSQPQ